MKRNILIFTLLLVTEIAIAVFHFHKFVRGFIGDVLVITLLFYFLRCFTRLRTLYLAGLVFLLGVLVELVQYSGMLNPLLKNTAVLRIVVGTTFDWKDILAYGIGTLLILFFEKNYTYENN
ncbi:MAG TPA: DUF2809 domain-containing protein [Flavobacteriaceae bacterium]|nr:hypothetical protein [Flavobacteriaceae bacterium]MAY52232.1 hypothetical protein [Flavobacteriaceae bacterium]HBR55217.1 DUF2809 domain-containing protein [Flavobacteriaceae bacterium]|tara:strand:+ start:231 stop:593 length:363 start_codon:yes stop_codon:yes gene_type:complete